MEVFYILKTKCLSQHKNSNKGLEFTFCLTDQFQGPLHKN